MSYFTTLVPAELPCAATAAAFQVVVGLPHGLQRLVLVRDEYPSSASSHIFTFLCLYLVRPILVKVHCVAARTSAYDGWYTWDEW